MEEESVSIEEINARIGIADELTCETPKSARRTQIHSKQLETIFEGQFLHTPPKSEPHQQYRSSCSEISNERMSKSWSYTTSTSIEATSLSFSDRLERH